MSQRQSLSISLQSLAVGPGTAYWLNMEQVQELTDAVTFEQAAEFIDALYDIDPCQPIEDEAGGEEAEQDGEGEPVAPVEEEEFVSLAQQMMERAALCGTLDGSYECVIRVARSHQGEPYKLAIDNGEELQRVTEQGRASQTLLIEGEASASLELPVLGNLTTEWQGPVYDLAGVCTGPEIELLGSTLNFGKRVTGTVTAHFDTQYDLVTLKINGNNEGEPQPARVLAFYAGLVAEHQVEPPEVSEEDEETKRLLCDQAGAGLNPTPDKVSCYELVDRLTRCRCSGTVRDDLTKTVEASVTCPDGLDCPGGESECRKLVNTRSVTVGYAGCPDEEWLEGDVGDPQFYLQNCCEPMPSWYNHLPPCRVNTSIFQGGQGISAEDMALYPGAAFIPVGPADGVCGDKVVTWQVVPRNCCDEAEPLAWDYELSPTLINRSSAAMVFVTGGAAYTDREWTVRGQGIWLDPQHTMKQGVTSGNHVWIYTDATACGMLIIEVTDGCTTASGNIRSTDGRWVLLCNDATTCEPYGCLGTDGEVSYEVDANNTSAVFTSISDQGYKRVETVTAQLFGPATGACGHPSVEGWADCVCAHYAAYFPGSNWPPCIDGASSWLLEESSTAANAGWCAANDRACVQCDEYGGGIRREGLYGYDDPYKHEITAVELWEWVC